MGRDRTEHGTAGLVLSLGAGEATGTYTVSVQGGAQQHAKCLIGIRVVAYAGWGGTVTLVPRLASGDTAIGGEPTAVAVGGLTASGTNGVDDTLFTGAHSIVISVAGNNKALTIYAQSWGDLEKGST